MSWKVTTVTYLDIEIFRSVIEVEDQATDRKRKEKIILKLSGDTIENFDSVKSSDL